MIILYALIGVALRKESVDRNLMGFGCLIMIGGSLSARRAWIEIVTRYRPTPKPVMSLSARRAWIEIASSREKRKHPERRSPQGERG